MVYSPLFQNMSIILLLMIPLLTMRLFSEEKKINDSEIEDCFKKLQCEADDALYMAKYKGKDQYCIYEKGKEKEYLEVREKYMK